ncbi:NAD(P)/FAD-dependent oxidoreductase [uncultured Planktosalinus sp.]|uniref:NAD(P)/FAD-dependent oxidoreductase n=1 Tax=uncultured Planktosalinus sp. TaxID=1810935 RepID=UPI0030DB1EAA
MIQSCDIAIIGGGLAGLTAALHLSNSNFNVLVFEKNPYPRHKVCGEYVSNEVLPYLNSLGIHPFQLGAKSISLLQVSNRNGLESKSQLQLGGFGISRYTLDHHLYTKVKERVPVLQETVTEVKFQSNQSTIETLSGNTVQARFVIGAFGKRSNLDKSLLRPFIQKKTQWMAVKSHYTGDFPEHMVSLHHFKGGYCGLSKIENNNVNLCYLTTIDAFKRYKVINDFEENALSENPFLKNFLKQATPVFDTPLTISQISFERKKAVDNHVFMIGDSASLIHPLCGNGMAMAITAAKLVADTFLQNKNSKRNELEKIYMQKWNSTFSKRLSYGRLLQAVMMNSILLNTGLKLSKRNTNLISFAVSKTHGKPL